MASPTVVRGALVVLAVLVAVAYGVRGSSDDVRPTGARTANERRDTSPHPVLAFGVSPAPFPALTGYVPDGGATFANYDAGLPEAPPLDDPGTGALARAITERMCPSAARTLCRARDTLGCEPMPAGVDDEGNPRDETCIETIQRQCGEWASRHYGWLSDALVPSEPMMRDCLDTMALDAHDGLTLTLDRSCGELGMEPVREGEACTQFGFACGDDATCFEDVCLRDPGPGEPCDEGWCGRGLVCTLGLCDRPTPRGGACDEDSTCERRGDWCVDGRCAPSVGAGGACDYDTECDVGSRCDEGRCRPGLSSCTLDEDCGRGRTCSGPYAAHCEAYASFGARCHDEDDCTIGLDCVEHRCVPYGFVAPGPLRLGDRCNGSAERCGAGLVCLFDGEGYTCQRAAEAGENCEGVPCAESAACIWRVSDGACMPALCGAIDLFSDPDEE